MNKVGIFLVAVFISCSAFQSANGQIGVISDLKFEVNGAVMQRDANNNIFYPPPSDLKLTAKCTCINDRPARGGNVQFHCLWKLHQAPLTNSSQFDPLLNPTQSDSYTATQLKDGATGTWTGNIIISYDTAGGPVVLMSEIVHFKELGP